MNQLNKKYINAAAPVPVKGMGAVFVYKKQFHGILKVKM
jgi:hypothetical protein